MADVAMEEAVPAPIAPTMTRREHLAKTFEAYRSELDEAVGTTVLSGLLTTTNRMSVVSRSLSARALSPSFPRSSYSTATVAPLLPLPLVPRTSRTAATRSAKSTPTLWRSAPSSPLALTTAATRTSGSSRTACRLIPGRIGPNDSTGGLEEYIEAYTFLYYLETKELAPLAELQKALSDESGAPVG